MLDNLLHETEEYHIDRIFPSLIICPAFYFLRDKTAPNIQTNVYHPARKSLLAGTLICLLSQDDSSRQCLPSELNKIYNYLITE